MTGPDTKFDALDIAWRFFISLRLSVALFILIGALLTAGTFTQQLDIYHSLPLSILLLLLCLNLIACSIDRIPRVWQGFCSSIQSMEQPRWKHAWSSDADDRSTAEHVAAAFKLHLGGATVATGSSTTTVSFDSGRISRLAVLAVHLGVVLILAGGLLTATFGREGTLFLGEGESSTEFVVSSPDGTTSSMKLPFAVRCDRFTYEQFADGRPKSYRSLLTVMEDGKPPLTREISVNSPLHHGGLGIYQSSFREDPAGSSFTVEFEEVATGRKAVATAREGSALDPGAGWTDGVYSIAGYMPDLGGFGEALRISRSVAGKEPERFLLFRKYPGFDLKNRAPAVTLRFVSAKPAYATGLMVSGDPGSAPVFAGAALMLLGLFAAFFWNHRQAAATVSAGTVTLVADVNRNPRDFGRRIADLVAELNPK
ncbi:MAG: cytochrome c biogenesis protein ResB [Myxococcota bacterium]